MASTQLNKSVQKNAGNDNITKMTFSAWIKRSALGEGTIIAAHQLSTYYTHFYFNSDDRIQIYSYINSSTAANLVTERRFQDTNCWLHIVFTVDTTLGTSTDRMKIYVNGVRETAFNGGTTFPAQNSSFGQFSDTGATLNIGNTANRGAFSGLMSHVHYIPYTAYDASAFGSTDATTGEWKINTSPSVTYSTAGFFILKNGNSVTDQSGEGNNFTVGAGTLTNTEDCPSNVFCTLNPLDKPSGASFDLTHGNTTLGDSGSGDNDMALRGTIGAKTGKYYWEVKNYNAGTLCVAKTGIRMVQSMTDSSPNSGVWGVQSAGNGTINSYNNGSFSNSNSFTDWSSGDIISMALDLDNGKLFYAVNGTWKGLDNNTADPANGTNPCFTGISAGDEFITVFTEHRSGGDPESSFNFGNGYFGTTAISSEGTNASGIGKFEYNVPTGFTALSTKGLNE